jgi:hypothetical protein
MLRHMIDDRRVIAAAATAALAVALLALSGCGKGDVRLSIAAPRDRDTVRTSTIRVRGRVDPPDAAVLVDDRAVDVRDGAFALTVSLHRGRNRINVAATSSGRPSDIRDLVVRRARTHAEIAAARRRRDARRTAAAARRALLANSSRQGRYPQLVRDAYMSSCRINGTLQVCRCTLSYLEAHASLASLQRTELEVLTRGTVPRILTDAVAACRSGGA